MAFGVYPCRLLRVEMTFVMNRSAHVSKTTVFAFVNAKFLVIVRLSGKN